ncbi:hypothetical protein B0H13DRAFT_1936352 [Mycena leptocephala]|nr:hypothetical protein B0H13DRAFT_1936352 [Mycena leptocephala]
MAVQMLVRVMIRGRPPQRAHKLRLVPMKRQQLRRRSTVLATSVAPLTHRQAGQWSGEKNQAHSIVHRNHTQFKTRVRMRLIATAFSKLSNPKEIDLTSISMNPLSFSDPRVKFPECGPGLNGKDFKTRSCAGMARVRDGPSVLAHFTTSMGWLLFKGSPYLRIDSPENHILLENGYNGQDPETLCPPQTGQSSRLMDGFELYFQEWLANARVLGYSESQDSRNVEPTAKSTPSLHARETRDKEWGSRFCRPPNVPNGVGLYSIPDLAVPNTVSLTAPVDWEGYKDVKPRGVGDVLSTKHGDPWGEQGFVAFTGEDGIRNELRLTLLHEEVGANMANGTSRGKNKAVSRSADLGDLGDA